MPFVPQFSSRLSLQPVANTEQLIVEVLYRGVRTLGIIGGRVEGTRQNGYEPRTSYGGTSRNRCQSYLFVAVL